MVFLQVVELADGILAGSRAALAQGITLLQARHPKKRAQGNYLMGRILQEERERFKQKGADALIFRIGRLLFIIFFLQSF